MWVTEASPPDFSWTEDRGKTKVGLVPPRNGTIFRIVDFVPSTPKIESMDINTMIEERLMQCCVHVGTQDADAHQCVPFCAAQAWRPLSVMKPSEVVAQATRAARAAELVAGD